MKKVKELLMNFIRGFCMSWADSVPGVSGGTVAFLLGFYDKFIGSLDDLFRGNKEEKIQAFKFLFKIGIGWIIGFALAISILADLFDVQIYNVSSLFIGFIIFAIPIVIHEEKHILKGKWKSLPFILIGIVFVVAITLLNPVSGEGINVSVEHLTIGLGIYVFVAAMLAITAMILPGISGSTLLLIFGVYIPIVSGLKALMHGDLAYLPIVIIFCFGVLAGVVVFIRLIRKCLESYRTQTVYAIIGMMIGSLYSIVQGPTTLEVPKAAMGFDTFSILFFIIGGACVLGLQGLKFIIDKDNIKKEEINIEK